MLEHIVHILSGPTLAGHTLEFCSLFLDALVSIDLSYYQMFLAKIIHALGEDLGPTYIYRWLNFVKKVNLHKVMGKPRDASENYDTHFFELAGRHISIGKNRF